MFYIITLLLLSLSNELYSEIQCENVEDTDLIMVVLVNRHGDRTPEQELIFLSNVPDKLTKLSLKYGFMQLNDAGKARSFALGKRLRHRYGKLLSPTFDPTNILLVCSNITRCIDTANIAMTAAYSPEESWRDGMELMPVECAVVSSKNSYLAPFSCPKLGIRFINVVLSNNEQMKPYVPLLQELSQTLPVNITKYPILLYIVYDFDNSQLSMGLPISESQTKLWKPMGKGAGKAMDILIGDKDYLPLQAGVPLRHFLDTADKFISGVEVPKLTMYSAHDTSVYSFLALSKARPKQGVPKYCSDIALELRRCASDGKYYVVPVYISSPEEPEQYLHVEGCDHLCEYTKYKEMVYNNTLDLKQFVEQCKIDVDTNK